MSLLATAVLALVVAHGRSPYPFENRALGWLGPPSAIPTWADFVAYLGDPAICAAVLVSVCLGFVRRALSRVVVFAVFAAVALLTSEHLVKPLVQRTYAQSSPFPPGTSPR